MQSDILRGTMDNKQKLPRKIRKVLVEKKRRERIESCLQDIKQLLFQGTQYQKMEKAELLEGVVKHLEYTTKIANNPSKDRSSPHPEAQYRLGYLHCMREVTNILQHVPGNATPVAMSITQYLHNKVNNMTSIGNVPNERVHNVPVQRNARTPQREVNVATHVFPVYKSQDSYPRSSSVHNQLCDSYRTLRDNIHIINKTKSCENGVICVDLNVSNDHVVPGNEHLPEIAEDLVKPHVNPKENIMNAQDQSVWRPW